MQIREAGKDETALAVYWVIDSVDRCQVGFVPWDLVKHMGKYNGVLVQTTDVFSTVDDSNYRRKKAYKNHGVAKAVLISACYATNEAEEAMACATTSKEDATASNEYTKKTQQCPERKDH